MKYGDSLHNHGISKSRNSEGATIIGHITQKSLKQSYYDLTERAKIDLDFLLLTVSAAIICALGFRMNSAAVIVGAMVISPLLFPVICAGAAITRPIEAIYCCQDICGGLCCRLAAAVVVGLFSATIFRSEIIDRLSASGMDYVLVALFSGVAGTYAFFSPKIHEAVAGIAISVAVISPIVMLGIGLGIGIAEQNANLVLVSGTIVLSNVIGIYLGSIVMVSVLHRILRYRVGR